MNVTRFIAIGFVASLFAWGTTVPATATPAEPCIVSSDHVGDNEVFNDDQTYSDVFWSLNSPMHVLELCADTFEIDDVIFSENARTSTSQSDTFSRDAFDGFGEIYFGDNQFVSDSWSVNGSTVTGEMAFDRGTDIQNITATLNWTGNTLTWTVDNEESGNPSSALDFRIEGDVGSDDYTVIEDMGNGVWITHDANTRSDPILVWKAVGAAMAEIDPDFPDGIGFQWTEDSSVELQLIVIPNVQCYEDELDEEGDRVPVDDQSTWDQAFEFASDTVAPNFDDYAGDTIDPIGDVSCGANLAETGADITPMGIGALGALALGAAAVFVRRRNA